MEPAGKRRRRSLGQVRSGGSSRNYYVRFPYPGRPPIERAAGPNRGIADRKLAQVQVLLAENASLERILEEVFGERQPASKACPTLREAIPLYLAAAGTRLRASTLEGYEKILRTFSVLPWAAERLDEIEPGTIKTWRASRLGEVSAPTLNRCLSALAALFTWAVDEELIDANPARRVKKLSERGRAREAYLTGAESRALIRAASPDFRPFLVAALATGMRRGELMRMTWSSVDLERRTLTVEPENAKSGKARTIPISAWLHEVVLERAKVLGDGRASGHPFGWPDGRPFSGWEVRREFAAALAACAEIPEEKKKKVVVHTLRHTAASLMVAAGVPLFDVAQILGHSTMAMTMRYAHFAPEAGRAAIDALDRRLRPPSADGVAEAVTAGCPATVAPRHPRPHTGARASGRPRRDSHPRAARRRW